MTVKQFDDYLNVKRAEFMEGFQDIKDIKDQDLYTKMVLDHQESIAKGLFDKLDSIQGAILNSQSKMLEDNRKRFTILMKEIEELKKGKS